MKLKVAAYCRVSTDSLEQESSYEAQCVHYIEYIQNNSRWELAGIYADEGISGTSTKHRDQFNQMIQDCETGKINMIITKSISRFARNTLDCLQYIRKLKELGIAIYFEKEAINTLDAKGEVLITIMASIAQQESQSISQNVRMGIQYKMQQGKGNLNTKSLMGFDRGEESDMQEICCYRNIIPWIFLPIRLPETPDSCPSIWWRNIMPRSSPNQCIIKFRGS